jgi:hypothetical protein
MAAKTYSLKAQYVLPAGSMATTYMDGVYIDGGLFENNIKVLDGVIRIGCWPDKSHTVDHWANFGFPSFQNGRVERIGHKFWWAPGEEGGKSYDIRYNGHPYGIGLNTIAAQLSLSPLPITRDIIYDVVYVFILEVG